MELTPEQLQRIEENRKKALERLQQNAKRQREELEEALQREEERERDSLPENPHRCQCTSSTGSRCTAMTVDKLLLEHFNEAVCFDCKQGNDDFELVTKTECAAKYLVTQDGLTTMKFFSKINPLQPGWKPMKLYLRKHAKALAVERFGSLAALEEERRRREEQKFQRDLEKTKNILSSAAEEYRQELHTLKSDKDAAEEESETAVGRKRKASQKSKSINKSVKYFKDLAESLKQSNS